jgi:hypothetical protein
MSGASPIEDQKHLNMPSPVFWRTNWKELAFGSHKVEKFFSHSMPKACCQEDAQHYISSNDIVTQVDVPTPLASMIHDKMPLLLKPPLALRWSE